MHTFGYVVCTLSKGVREAFTAQLWHVIRFCMLRNVADEAASRRLKTLQKLRHSEYQLDTVQKLLLMPITVCVLAIIGWVGLGCALTNYYMPEVRPHIAVYWTITTLTTIGPSEVVIEGMLFRPPKAWKAPDI